MLPCMASRAISSTSFPAPPSSPRIRRFFSPFPHRILSSIAPHKHTTSYYCIVPSRSHPVFSPYLSPNIPIRITFSSPSFLPSHTLAPVSLPPLFPPPPPFPQPPATSRHSEPVTMNMAQLQQMLMGGGGQQNPLATLIGMGQAPPSGGPSEKSWQGLSDFDALTRAELQSLLARLQVGCGCGCGCGCGLVSEG